MEMSLNFGDNTLILQSFFERLKNLKRSERVQIADHGTDGKYYQAFETAGRAAEEIGIGVALDNFVTTHDEIWFCDHAPNTLWQQTLGAARALAVGEKAIGKENFVLLYAPFAKLVPVESLLEEVSHGKTLARG